LGFERLFERDFETRERERLDGLTRVKKNSKKKGRGELPANEFERK